MSIPKEPRQIMINLMYLVLTALLALNVSNEILNAFKVLSKGISDSNVSIDQKTSETYALIKANELEPGQTEKVRPYRIKADEVVKRSNELWKYLEEWKERIVIKSGGRLEDSSIKAEGDIDATTSLLVEQKGGDTLRQKIAELRKFLLETAPDSNGIKAFMPLRVEGVKKSEHNPEGDWNRGYFEHMPVVAAQAMFSKFQNDVRSSEALVIKSLFDAAHLKELKFDTLAAVAVPTTSYALAGDKIEASILLAAFNKTNKPVVTISQGGGSKKEAKNGVIPWETIASGTGLQTVRGTISLNTPEQGMIKRDWKFEYMVGSTGASMQLDKMNVFYIGVPNPVTVAAAGYSVEDVSLDIPGAKFTGSNGKYVVEVDKVGKIQVKINAKAKDGTTKNVGGMEVRVKRIPDPVASVNRVSSGPMPASIFRLQIAPAAILDNFDFDAKFRIVSFQFSLGRKGQDIQGPFTDENNVGCRFADKPEIKRLQDMAKPGDKIFIESIKAVGPDGQKRTLNPIILSLN